MADEKLEELRAKLLEKGFKAPTSWKVPRLTKELTKFTEADENSEQKPSVDESSDSPKANPEQKSATDETPDDLNESTDESTEQSDSTKANSDQKSPADETTDESSDLTDALDETANDEEDLNDKVTVKAKTAFSNERLGLKNIKEGKEFTVTTEQAEFLVTVDRTCEYVND